MSAIQGLGVAYFKIKNYNEAQQYAEKLVAIVIRQNKLDNSISKEEKARRYCNAKVFYVTCLCNLTGYNPLSEHAENEWKLLLKELHDAFEPTSIESVVIHVALGKMFIALRHFENMFTHFQTIQFIRTHYCEQDKKKAAELLMELIDNCLAELQRVHLVQSPALQRLFDECNSTKSILWKELSTIKQNV
ncbi:hypothetical protein RFI_06902 [Reticulomyxa filosa]|uniref:Uncharacterized protein n=1 Tax=Reticulomyxa filosa TaxID=46433 RepID=X6NWF9_RETFI|nr:hypothetical protein RFI_06902 [Reticulomyxa filosa]|eukprot:ETO30218.1 hypothetical protein RFI_06902 [Reticulomyxa filosa]